MKGEAEKLNDSLHQPIAHDSAALYVTGAAQFTDDIAFPGRRAAYRPWPVCGCPCKAGQS